MADQRIEKWTRWIDGTIKNNVLTMHLQRDAYRKVSEMLRVNADTLPESYWWEFMLDTYATTQAVAVRRQADPHPDAASLRNLVEELRSDAARLTMEFWLSLWGELDSPVARQIAEKQWLEHYGRSVRSHLDPAIPTADLEALTDASASIKGYVDRHIAHAQSSAAPAAVTLKVKDLHNAIDVIGAVFGRYYSLFTASTMIELVPVIDHDWMAAFRVPWMGPETSHD